MSYLGSAPAPSGSVFAGVYSQAFNGDGSTTSFTLGRYVAQPANIEVIVNNVQQSPFDGSYTLSGGTTLVFSEAPSSGTNNIYVIYRDYPVQTLTDTGAVRKTGDTMSGRLDFQNSDGNSVVGIQASRFGYSSGYEVLQIGRGSNLETISLGVDVSGNPSGSFTGHGKEIIVPNGASFISPTSDNSTFLSWLRCDSAGRVTMPYQPAFLYRINSAFTAPNNGWTKISQHLTTKDFDITNSVSAGRFTAPVAGRYIFYAGGWSVGNINGERYALSVVVNSGTQTYISGGNYSNIDSPMSPILAILNLAANDYVEIFGYSAISTTWGHGTHAFYFGGHLIG